MTPHESGSQHTCGECGITEAAHQDLYQVSLGELSFSFRLANGPELKGRVHLCRPCTHEVLSRRLLAAAGVSADSLPAEVWT